MHQLLQLPACVSAFRSASFAPHFVQRALLPIAALTGIAKSASVENLEDRVLGLDR